MRLQRVMMLIDLGVGIYERWSTKVLDMQIPQKGLRREDPLHIHHSLPVHFFSSSPKSNGAHFIYLLQLQKFLWTESISAQFLLRPTQSRHITTRDSSEAHAGRQTHPPKCRPLRTELHRSQLCRSRRASVENSTIIRGS